MEHEAVKNPVISVGDWMLTLFILAIPLVNIIFLFIWAFSGDANPSKATYAKASLLWIAIIFVVTIIFSILIFSAGIFGIMSGM